MTDREKTAILEEKIQALEILRDKCTLTNDIKVSLGRYIQQNQDHQDRIIQEIEKISITPEKSNSSLLVISIGLNILLLISIGNHFYLSNYEEKIRNEENKNINKQQQDKNSSK